MKMSKSLPLKIMSDSLFEKSIQVSEDEFGEELDAFMSEMLITMYANQGVGLAGVQVGDPRRFLVADISFADGRPYRSESLKVVNPRVLATSEETTSYKEQCLSYPGLSRKVDRPKSIIVEYYTPFGERRTEEFEDDCATILSHEIDHLDGVTLYTRMSKASRDRYNKKLSKKLNNLADGLKKRVKNTSR
jgi:peptide deformylase